MATAAIAVAAAAPVARAGFTPPTPIVSAKQLDAASDPVAVDGRGTSTVVWDEFVSQTSSKVKGRRVGARGTAGPTLPLSPAGELSEQAVVASTPGGRSFVAWRNEPAPPIGPTGVKGRWIEPNGTLGPVLTIVDPSDTLDAVDLRVAIAPSGTATVTWVNQAQGSDEKMGARRIASDGALSPIVPDMSGGGGVTSPRIVALPDGSTLATWRDVVINTAVLPPNGPPPAMPTRISTTVAISFDPAIATDAAGDSLVAWGAEDVSTTPAKFVILARQLDPTGAPSGPEITIDLPAEDFASEAAVASDSAGHFLISWTRNHGNQSHVHERRLGLPAHAVSPANLSSGGGVPFVLDDGSTGLAWRSSLSMMRVEIQGRELDSTGTPFGTPKTLLDPGSSPQGVSNPKAGVGATVTPRFTSNAESLFLNRFLAHPSCAASSARVVQGRPVFARLACTGPAIEGARVTGKPKHGTAGPFRASPAPALRYKPKPGFAGTDRFTYRALNDGGRSGKAKVTVTVGRDTVRPRITSARFRKARRLIALKFSEPATARVTISLRHGGKHVRTLRAKRQRRSVRIHVPSGLVRGLRRGTLRATAVARDAAGNRSRSKRVRA